MCDSMKIRYILCLVVVFLFVSCSNEEESDGASKQFYGKVNVMVSVTLPQPEPAVISSRSYTDADIRNVDVLVFDKDGKFMERVKVEDSQLVTTGSGVTFTVRLDATSERRIVHLVANGRSADGVTDRLNFVDMTLGADENTVISSLQTIPSGDAAFSSSVKPLVMWGRFVLDDGINIITAANVKLLRSTACIQVKKAANNSDNGLGDFVIQGVTVYRGMQRGFLAPANCTGSVSTPVTANPIPGTDYLDYQKGWIYAETPFLYIYERTCTASDYMSVILKGSYLGKTGYYKIVMTDPAGIPLDVIRNHRYIITITDVNGPGYENVTEAIGSAPSNSLKMTLDDDTGFSCTIADGNSWMSSSNNVFDLYGKAASGSLVKAVEICTVYSSRNILPVLTLPDDCTWLDVKAQSLGGGKYRITGDYSVQSSPDIVSTVLTMTCDNLILPVRINWNPIISVSKDADSYVLDLINPSDKNWNVQIVTPSSTKWLSLHPSNGTPNVFPGGSGMMSGLNSKYASHAYLHVLKSTNKQGRVLKSSVSAGKIEVRKVLIVQ